MIGTAGSCGLPRGPWQAKHALAAAGGSALAGPAPWACAPGWPVRNAVRANADHLMLGGSEPCAMPSSQPPPFDVAAVLHRNDVRSRVRIILRHHCTDVT